MEPHASGSADADVERATGGSVPIPAKDAESQIMNGGGHARSSRKMSISRAITLHATERPDDLALTCDDETLTWRDLDCSTNRLARAYAEMGVSKGDLVTIALMNSVTFVESVIATWKLGATPQPVSARLPKRELEEIVALADSRIVVGVDEVNGVLRIPAGRTVVPSDFEPDASIPDDPLPDAVSPSWKAPTSGGSTGRPKIIVVADPGLFDVDDVFPGVDFPIRSSCVIPGPLYHNAPLSFSTASLVAGNHTIIFARFLPRKVLNAATRYRAKFLYLCPTMMARIVKLPREVRGAADLSSLRMLLHTASHCPPWLKEEWIRWVGPENVHELYAGTEFQSACWITGEDWLCHRGSVGRPISGKMMVVGEDGKELPRGQVGEIYMLPTGGRDSTYRYLGGEASRLGDTDWESLGDMGSMDEEGYIYLADRRKDVIHRGGSNIYPAEVEAAIDEHPSVRSCAVVGLPDDDLGQRVHAIVDAPGVGVKFEAELRAHCADRLVGYKRPSTYEFVDDLVRDDAGKVRRSQLAAERSCSPSSLGSKL